MPLLRFCAISLLFLGAANAAFAQNAPELTPIPAPEPLPTPAPFRAFQTEEQLAPGLNLRRVATMTPNGPLRYFVVCASPKQWNLGLQLADPNDVVKKRSPRALAATSKAPVVMNGGFFAYGGAALGAVKVGGKWQRMPWKNRTALGWDSATGKAQIASFPGNLKLFLKYSDGKFRSFEAALNGFMLAGSAGAITDGFAVLTPFFAPKYRVKTNEIVALVRGADVVSMHSEGEIAVPRDGFLLVARGSAISEWSGITKASFEFNGDKNFDQWPNILGAGPRLVEAGKPKTTEKEEEFRPDVLARGPRSAVGFDAQGNWIFLVVNGRQTDSVGLTLPETANLIAALGAREAMNLDGGSSTQLVINGQLVNTPSAFDSVDPTKAREVMVPNALIFTAK